VLADPHTGKLSTRVLSAGAPSAVAEAAAWLRRGYPVVFPTDTVYGVGVLPFDDRAVEWLYAVKGRPATKGIPILLADLGHIDAVAAQVPAAARALIERFWPGPLTLVVPRRPELPENISPDGSIAVRLPDHPIARALIREAGGAVATSSANRSGQAPARDASEALDSLGGYVAAILDDGASPGGVASTVVDCTGVRPVVTREGPLSAAVLGLEGGAIPS
jgi:L-threonylcarbamoyladenylate synthase